MRIAVLAETDAAEPRVAATPETVKKFINLGAEVDELLDGFGRRRNTRLGGVRFGQYGDAHDELRLEKPPSVRRSPPTAWREGLSNYRAKIR